MAWYKTGTVTTVKGQTSVSATGTKFASNARVGDGFRGPDGEWYEIVNIASETVLGIFPAYEGDDATASPNWMIAPLQGYNKETADRLREITNSLRDVSGEVQEALEAATEAKAAAVDAKTSETNSKTSETNSEANATTATNAANAASTSKDASVAAQAAAETARDEAVAAAGTVSGVVVDLGNVDLSSGVYPAKPATSAFWRVSVGGVVDGTTYAVGDILNYSKTNDLFYKAGGGGGAVSSVNGKTGDVTINKSDVGLSNVNNTTDANKPVSTAQQSALDNKVDKVAGKQLSTEDYTTVDKNKLAAIATDATKNQTDTYLLNRANHTGTQLASTISDLSAAVRLVTLSGLVLSDAAIVSADTVLVALGKAQGQINARAKSGINSDITEIKGLTEPLSISQGGNGSNSGAVKTDVNGVLNNGRYITGNTWTGSVFAGTDNKNSGYIIHDNYDTNSARQTWDSIDPSVAQRRRFKVAGAWSDWAEVSAGGSSLPVGALMAWNASTRANLPGGWIARDGQLLNRADWPDLWALYSVIAVDDSVWLAAPYTSRGLPSKGNGTTTFRMPDSNAKHPDGNTIAAMTFRGDGKNSAGSIGLHQADQLQNITGSVTSSSVAMINSTDATGAFVGNTVSVGARPSPVSAAGYTWGFDASRVARTGTETRGSNETVILCTVGAGKAVNVGSVDVTSLATTVSDHSAQIQSKVGNNDPRILTAWVNFDGTTGAIKGSYNVASVTRSAVGTYRINFITPMTNINYVPVCLSNALTATDQGNQAYPVALNLAYVDVVNRVSGSFVDRPFYGVSISGGR